MTISKNVKIGLAVVGSIALLVGGYFILNRNKNKDKSEKGKRIFTFN